MLRTYPTALFLMAGVGQYHAQSQKAVTDVACVASGFVEDPKIINQQRGCWPKPGAAFLDRFPGNQAAAECWRNGAERRARLGHWLVASQAKATSISACGAIGGLKLAGASGRPGRQINRRRPWPVSLA